MKHIAHFMVKHRKAIFMVTIAIAIVCAFAATRVPVNMDMTKYLPANMQMKQGQDIMTEQFGESSSITLVAKIPDTEKREALADELDKFDIYSSVTYDADDERYNNGDYARYDLSVDAGSNDDEVKQAVELAETICNGRGYEYYVDASYLQSAVTDTFTLLMIFAVCVAMLILFILAESWIEPLLLIFVILIAVLINLGTNIFMGEVSQTTYTIGAILQMVLSMDYIIMLLNRYRNERAEGLEPKPAMERAIERGVSAIASSSITTVAGLLCLVLMSFTIGRDLGIALAKGVFFSLVCAFTLMPAIIMWTEGYMEATRKPSLKPQMKALSTFSYKARYVMVAVFVILLAVGLGTKNISGVSFLIPSENPQTANIEELFGTESQVVVLYTADEEDEAGELTEQLSQMDGVVSASSYASSLGKQYTATALADKTAMDAALLKVLYYKNFVGSDDAALGTMTGAQLSDYVENGLANDLGDALDDDTKDNLSSLATLIDNKLDADTVYSPTAAADALSDVQSLSDGMVRLIYLAHAAGTNFNDAWTMSTDELMTFLVNDVLTDPTFDDLIDSDNRTKLTDAAAVVTDAKARLVNDEYGRIVLKVGYDASSSEMGALCTQMRSMLDGQLGQYWLVGEGPMVQEMTASFADEFNFLSIVTVLAIFLIVLITFRNVLIPALLVALIQTAFNFDLLINAAIGSAIYYVALLVVQSILMGATIDYAILYTTSYREARQTLGVRDAVAQAYRASIRTIAMSGSILVLVCFVLGFAASGITAQICLVISEGALASVILVLLVLPGTLAALDRVVTNRKKSAPAK